MPLPRPSARELSYALFGAWRFAHLDTGAIRYFDKSVDGFWKSFWAAAIIAPAYLILIVIGFMQSEKPPSAGPVEIAIVEVSRYVISWVAFPLAMVTVSEFLQRGERYIGFVVAYNWGQIVEMAFVLPLFLFVAAAGFPQGAANLVSIAIVALTATYEWFIARTALQVSGWAAGGVVAVSLVIDFFFVGLANGLIA